MCNLSIKWGSFPNSCKIAKLKFLFKKGSKSNPSNYKPISLLPLIYKVIESLSVNKKVVFYLTMKFYTTINQDFRKTAKQTRVMCLHDKIWKGLIRGWWPAWYWLTSERLLIQLIMIYYWKNWALLVSQIILLVGLNHTFLIVYLE